MRHAIVGDDVVVAREAGYSEARRHQAHVVAGNDAGVRAVVVVHEVLENFVVLTGHDGIAGQDEQKNARRIVEAFVVIDLDVLRNSQARSRKRCDARRSR